MVFVLLAARPPVGVNVVFTLTRSDRLRSAARVAALSLQVSFTVPALVAFTLVLQTVSTAAAVAPLNAPTRAALEAAVGARRSGYILQTSTGKPLDRHNVSQLIATVTERAGISKRITPHSLRHTAITAALNTGVPLRDVQDFARHADPRTTRRYDLEANGLDRHSTYQLAAYSEDTDDE